MTTALIPRSTQHSETIDLAKPTLRDRIYTQWQARLAVECDRQNEATRSSILDWLLGADLERWETLDPQQLQIAERGMEYRLRILRDRYLGLSPERAYQHPIQRLGGLTVLREKIRAWPSQSRERQQTIVDRIAVRQFAIFLIRKLRTHC